MSINNIRFRPISLLKRLFVREGERRRCVPFGLYRGLTLELDLSSEAQTYFSLYERETHPYISKAARRASWFIDVGGRKGEMCIYFLKNTSARIVAVDPAAEMRPYLARAIAHNGLDPDRLEIITGFAGEGAGDEVRLDSLDIDRRRPGFIKIDVDGAELAVLRGAVGLLERADVDLLVEVHSASLEQQTISFLEARGYHTEIIRNAPWRIFLPELRPIELNRWVWAARA